MTITTENLTAEETEFVSGYVERERKISAHFVAEYERRMDRRQGVCMSGFDPTPYTMPTDEELTAQAIGRVVRQRQIARLKPQQDTLDGIASAIDASLKRAVSDVLRRASHDSDPSRAIDAAKLTALADLFPELRRELSDAKQMLLFMNQIAARGS